MAPSTQSRASVSGIRSARMAAGSPGTCSPVSDRAHLLEHGGLDAHILEGRAGGIDQPLHALDEDGVGVFARELLEPLGAVERLRR